MEEQLRYRAATAAKIAGTTPARVRYLVRSGLRLSASRRLAGRGWRAFTLDDCRRIALVQAVTDAGLPIEAALDQLSRLLSAPHFDPTKPCLLEVVDHHGAVIAEISPSTVASEVAARLSTIQAARPFSVSGQTLDRLTSPLPAASATSHQAQKVESPAPSFSTTACRNAQRLTDRS